MDGVMQWIQDVSGIIIVAGIALYPLRRKRIDRWDAFLIVAIFGGALSSLAHPLLPGLGCARKRWRRCRRRAPVTGAAQRISADPGG
jgi:hypothetical protein